MTMKTELDDYEKLAESIWQADHKNSPKTLYHYSTAEGSKSIIENNCFWASAFECMNDNKEFRHGMTLAKSEITQNISKLPTNKIQEMLDSWEKFIDCEAKNPLLRPYVISFCEDQNNQHLWEEYASKHQGALLQFENTTHDKSLISGVFIKTFYDQQLARNDLRNNLKAATDIFQNNGNVNGLKNLFYTYLQAIFKFSIQLKEPIWSKEKEWRFVILKNTKTDHQYGKIKFRHRGSILIDYLEVGLGLASLKIETLVLGARFPEQSVNTVRILVQAHPQIKLKI